ncbi:MAG: SIS domain-containing protein [Armatimonadota bacterium]|nr:SIS domain-containing protein [bacterium]
MALMLNEIYQQPRIIGSLWEKQGDAVERVVSDIRSRDIRFIILAARGTSDHAAIYGKYLFEIKNHMPVGLADASVYTIYDSTIKMDNVLVIGISQSGQAPDIIEYLTRSRANGALTVAIVNEPDSPMTQAVDHTLCCCAGPEKAVAATKTYTSSLAVLYALSSALNSETDCAQKLAGLADEMTKTLGIEEYIKSRVERYRYMPSAVIVSRGLNLCTALEMSLKVAETSSIGARGYSAADFLHGPIGSIHSSDPCFVIAPPGKALGVMGESLKKLQDRGAETVVISSEADLLECASVPLKMDAVVDEELSPMLYILPGQIFAYYLSRARFMDPDNPKGLSKVTKTR